MGHFKIILLSLTFLSAMGCASDPSFLRWHYQLQNYDAFVPKHGVDEGVLFVIDYSKDGTESAAFSAKEIRTLKHDGKNTVLAYLSVGEAEKVRWYFKNMPKDLRLERNPRWPDNYPVRYWDDRWHQIIYASPDSYLHRIVERGFDGIYLDVVDVYYQFMRRRKTAAAEMVHFVTEISAAAKRTRPGFLVFIQNAPCLFEKDNFPALTAQEYQKLRSQFFDSIDGIGLESTFFYGTKPMDNPYRPQQDVLKCVAEFRNQKKYVVGVEYVKDLKSREKALNELSRHGILGLVTDRDLKGEFFGYAAKESEKPR